MRHFIFLLGSEIESIQIIILLGTYLWIGTQLTGRLFLFSVVITITQWILLDYWKKRKILHLKLKWIKQHNTRIWFVNFMMYCKEMTVGQRHYADKCIYHLIKSHTTDECHVKHECIKLLADKREKGPPILLLLVNFFILLKKCLRTLCLKMHLIASLTCLLMIITKTFWTIFQE